MTDEMPKIVSHWKSLGIEFDAMYSGYFGKCEQLEIVSGFFSDFKSDGNLVFVDPVLGDEGRLYTGFDGKFVDKMERFLPSRRRAHPQYHRGGAHQRYAVP